ncbi:MAG: T9SS type A sorting domain-containing protein [Bacteroidales bacterium]|nr:T9SS type A sorting domain-containing protein [Bacteroidales bacterium]
MKRLLLVILLAFGGLTVFAQPSAKYVNLLPAYPPAVGETQYGNYVYTNSGLYMHDIILDSLPHYEIEHIPNQTVRYLEDGIGFYVKADSLHSNNVVYSYEVDQAPIGPFEFNATTGRFKFYPDAGDYMPFTVTFTATSGWNSLSQVVEFTMMPEVVPENLAIQSEGEMPSAQDYVIIAEAHSEMQLNNEIRTAYSYSISGKDVVFDNQLQNKVWGLSGREDIYELNLFAERLYIRSALEFPHTNVTIYAREIIFEDNADEMASINTTPSKIALLTNEMGMDGEDAGNITLHVKTLRADFAKRFILNGAQGQCANRNGTPGNGGNGGVFVASVGIENYCDFARGSAGVKYDVPGREPIEHGSVIGAGQAGGNGHFEFVNENYGWIHPYYIAAVIRHINDSYLNNYFRYSKTTANDYASLINEFMESDEWEDFDATLKVELQDQLTELEGLLYKLNENLDYFGNPLGWTPMLSFEVLLSTYNNEIDRAMPTLYLNYWLQHIDQTLASWVAASQFAADETLDEIEATRNQINALIEDIPVLEDKVTVLQSELNDLSDRLERLQAELLRKAKHNVKKRNRINKAFGIFKAALNCIPIFGNVSSSIISTIGTGVDYIGSQYFGVADTYGYGDSLPNAIQGIYDFNYGAALDTLQNAIDNIDLSNLGQTGHQLSHSYHYLESVIKPVYKSVMHLHEVLSHGSTPDTQVAAELEKLKRESADYQNLIAEINVVQQEITEFQAILTQTMVDMVSLTGEVSNEIVTLDALRKDVFEGNSMRDLQAMQCVEKMKQRAMNRLVKYHYYMRKAYEYRLLKPYQGEFDLENMYTRLETLIDHGQVFFDNSNPVSFEAYEALAALFREEVSGIIEDVVEEYIHNAPEQSAPITIIIPREWLDVINSNEDFILNLYELGIFSPEEENVRIVDFGVQHIETHVVGNVGYSAYMDLELEHNGISRFRKNGEIYWFNHISHSTTNPHTWGIRYDAISQEATTIEPSAAVHSLLESLLGSTNNIMIFSRPAAWSDIVMSKKMHTTGDADIVIDSLVLRLQYDFTRRPEGIRNIDITTNDDLLPYIACSEVDRNGRSNGKGSFHRSYNRSNGTVTFTALEDHGTYHFLNWTDRLGNVVSESPELTVNKQTDQFYKANYERRIPIINVADTIYVGCEGGEYEVQIQNIGLGDIEMDWYVEDSLSTWVHLNGITEGIDDGYFTFVYEPLRTRERRVDSLEILAPEIEGMSKMVYIVQYDNSYMEVSASINPEGAGTVEGTGFYELNDVAHLTAVPIDNCHFTAWECNGQIVSMQPEYTFTVTGNTHLIAHFECENMVSVSAEVVPEGSGFVTGSGLVNGIGLYEANSAVTLTATPINDCQFVAWECNGQVVSTQQVYTFIVSNDIHLVARFECGNMISVSAEVVPPTSGYVTGTGLYNIGDVVTLKAIPVTNWRFDKWTYNDALITNEDTYTFIAQTTIHYTANFKNNIGVDENESLNVKIYPNPSSDLVYVECENMKYVQVYSLLGNEKTHRTIVEETTVCIDMSQWPSGLYYFRVLTDKGYIIQKVMKF